MLLLCGNRKYFQKCIFYRLSATVQFPFVLIQIFLMVLFHSKIIIYYLIRENDSDIHFYFNFQGQGLKKFQHEKSQHYTNNLVFFTHQPLPSSTSFRSTYQASFVEYPNLESTLLGRFPKNHINRSIALRPADKKECMWFSKFYTRHPNILPVELEAPLPEPKKHLPALQAAE